MQRRGSSRLSYKGIEMKTLIIVVIAGFIFVNLLSMAKDHAAADFAEMQQDRIALIDSASK